ncbi:MAG: cytochrome c3 family protein [Thermodesulfobacteriota bacterium]
MRDRLIPIVLRLLPVVIFVCLAIRPAQGAYSGSAHGQNATGVARTDMLSKGFARGNCAHCHEQHASVDGGEPNPVGGAPSSYAGFASEENLCFGCHAAAGTVGTATDNIQTVAAKAYGHGTGTAANYLGAANRHKAGEISVTALSVSPHVECVDCHNPHEAKTGNHTAGGSGNTVSNALTGVSGVDFTTFPSNWAAFGGGTPAAYATATREYQICFKCHSSSNASMQNWDGAGALAWTDTALEFNPLNQSLHPVTVTLTAAANSIKLKDSQLTATWQPAGSKTMYCSDCHNVESGSPTGPHGSAVRWMLSGTNKAWPYQDFVNNGTSAGTYWDLNNRTTNSGTANGLFCLNCHPDPRSVDSNNVHRVGDHTSYVCLRCHIRVPHGGKIPRLLTDLDGGLPARYYPNGNGGGGLTGLTKVARVATGVNYGKSQCQSNCGEHGGYNPAFSW